LPDESEAGGEFIIFTASVNTLEITVGETSETLIARVVYKGVVKVPYLVFSGIARTLRFYRGKNITVASSKGLLKIARTEFRHSNISVLGPGELAVFRATPAKLQNL